MKINKNLAEALLMLSLIVLVLASTTDFNNPSAKMITMVSLGIMAIVMAVLRVLGGLQEKKEEE